MSEPGKTEAKGPIIGLTDSGVDWSLYNLESSIGAPVSEGIVDFSDVAGDYWRKHNRDASVRVSDRLEEVLKIARLQRLFFDPAEITSRLTKDSKLIVEKSVNKYGQEVWFFRINPAASGVTNYWEGPYFQVVRGQSKERGALPPRPYLQVLYDAYLEEDELTFRPHVSQMLGKGVPNKELENEMLKLLGIQKEIKTQQQLKVIEGDKGDQKYQAQLTVDIKD